MQVSIKVILIIRFGSFKMTFQAPLVPLGSVTIVSPIGHTPAGHTIYSLPPVFYGPKTHEQHIASCVVEFNESTEGSHSLPFLAASDSVDGILIPNEDFLLEYKKTQSRQAKLALLRKNHFVFSQEKVTDIRNFFANENEYFHSDSELSHSGIKIVNWILKNVQCRQDIKDMLENFTKSPTCYFETMSNFVEIIKISKEYQQSDLQSLIKKLLMSDIHHSKKIAMLLFCFFRTFFPVDMGANAWTIPQPPIIPHFAPSFAQPLDPSLPRNYVPSPEWFSIQIQGQERVSLTTDHISLYVPNLLSYIFS